MLLTVLGCIWLTATLSFSDLILNALALEFIICIDENILAFFLPQKLSVRLSRTKFAYPKVPPTPESTEKALIEDYVRNIIYFAVCLAITVLCVKYQQVLPDFPFDIEEHCGAWYMNQFRPKCLPFEKGCFPFGGEQVPHDYGRMTP